MKAKVQRWGNSLAIHIPKAYAANLRVDAGSVVDLDVVEAKLVVTPEPEMPALDALPRGSLSRTCTRRPTSDRRSAARPGDADRVRARPRRRRLAFVRTSCRGCSAERGGGPDRPAPRPSRRQTTSIASDSAKITHSVSDIFAAFPFSTCSTTCVRKPKTIPSLIEYVNGIATIATNAGTTTS